MKPLTKKVLESGLVDKHVARMFEQWGQLEPGSADMVGRRRVTENSLQAFVSDIEDLVEAPPEMHETVLDLPVKEAVNLSDEHGNAVAGYWDFMGHIVVPTNKKIRIQRGSRLVAATEEEARVYRVLDIEPLYQNDTMVALQISVSVAE